MLLINAVKETCREKPNSALEGDGGENGKLSCELMESGVKEN